MTEPHSGFPLFGASKQFAIGSEKRMRSVKAPDRDLMGDDTAKSLSRKPAMEMERWRLHLEGRRAQLGQIEVDRMIWRRTDRRCYARKHRQRRTMNVAGGDQPCAWMPPDDLRQFAGIEEVLAIHMPHAGLERRMMQEQQRRSILRRHKRCLEPVQRGGVEFAMRLVGNARIQQHEIELADFDTPVERARSRRIGGVWKCGTHHFA